MTVSRSNHKSAGTPVGPRVGITLRITLAAWMVTLVTLMIFVLVITPQQKKIFLDQLESKANSVALSVHDAAAGAAINEDYASVINAAQVMLEGDPSVDFLVVMKNDGFSLVIEQSGWRVEQQADAYWLKRERVASGKIITVPLFNRRVFHFAKPFDYSGIQWGWIHVGLSLKDYDRSIASLYKNTLMLAFGCIAFSFLISWVYSRQIVRPVLRLRGVVRQIADGDLSVRADHFRRDELGSLADSVNTMTDALLRRDRILESVRFAAQEFMYGSRWEEVIEPVLSKIGSSADVSHAYVFENIMDDSGRLCFSRRFEWTADGIGPRLSSPDLRHHSYADSGFGRWIEFLRGNETISGSVSGLPVEERAFFELRGALSIITIPVFVEGTWWGFIGLDDCLRERIWTDPEKDSLRAGADMFGATIARQQAREALMEAKATLEQRVQERTKELQTQVAAKETALSELATAQSTLLEVSRAAGMAEVATGVLHNVGNVLNSVNVSCTLLSDQLRESRVGNLSKVVDLMSEPEGGLARFLSEDPRGRQIPHYLASLSTALLEEHQVMQRETGSLQSRIEHIKEIVSMQQSYGRVSGVNETISAEQLMEDALKLYAASLARHEIAVCRKFESVPPITVDKHAVLQILLNLINNAKHACSDVIGREKTITLKILSHGPFRVRMQVEDNGVGIAPENLTRIFQHGFTTRKSGHGFGLHSGALAARKLGGRLSLSSEGLGLGAAFTLELPCYPGETHETV